MFSMYYENLVLHSREDYIVHKLLASIFPRNTEYHKTEFCASNLVHKLPNTKFLE